MKFNKIFKKLSNAQGCGGIYLNATLTLNNSNGNVAVIYDSDMIESNDVMRMARTVAPEIYM